MTDPKLIQLSVVTAVAGATIVSIMVIPFYWQRPEPAARLTSARLSMQWPDEALVPPSAEPFVKRVTTERFVAMTEVAKSPAGPAAPAEASTTHTRAPEPTARDVCAKEGGYKVITHHGRGWRCRYPRRR